MTIITVQIGKTLGFLGRVEFARSSVKAGLSQVNGAIDIATRFGLKCAVESMPKSGHAVGKILSQEEARCFAAEHKSGYQR